MKWIKASERLHDNDHEFVFLKGCRVDKGILRKENVHSQTMIALYYNDGIGTNELSAWKEGHEELDSIFWLDESPSGANVLVEHLQDFLDAVPPQTDDADWWPDNLSKAVESAKKFLAQYNAVEPQENKVDTLITNIREATYRRDNREIGFDEYKELITKYISHFRQSKSGDHPIPVERGKGIVIGTIAYNPESGDLRVTPDREPEGIDGMGNDPL